MSGQNEKDWHVLGASVQGASHVQASKPNQDAIRWKQSDTADLPLMLAISDGHGSDKYFRSHIGAQSAVRIAIEEMDGLVSQFSFPMTNFTIVKHLLTEELPKSIVTRWQQEMMQHWEEHPLTREEWEILNKKESATTIGTIFKNPIIPYGATLLAVLITPSFILYLQLGDGDIVIVLESGQSIKLMPADKRLVANETTSLCSTTAATLKEDFRKQFHILEGAPPLLIMVSTDGYSNSFTKEEGFLKAGTDILQKLREEGVDAVNASLSQWLRETSERGSGDDISLGLLFRMSALRRPAIFPLEPSANLAENTDSQVDAAQRNGNQEVLTHPEEPVAAAASAETLTGAAGREGEDAGGHPPTSPQQPMVRDEQPGERATPANPVDQSPALPGSAANIELEKTMVVSRPPARENAPDVSPPVPPEHENIKLTNKIGIENAPDASPPVTPAPAPQQEREVAAHQPEVPVVSPPAVQPVPPVVPPPAVQPVPQAMSNTIVVSQQPADGQYSSINEALKHARAGTRIEVHPGTYQEHLLLKEDVELVAAGPQGAVVLSSSVPCIEIQAEQAVILGFKLHGLPAGFLRQQEKAVVDIPTGHSRLIDCTISSDSNLCVRVHGTMADPVFTRCTIYHSNSKGILFTENAQGMLLQCEISGHPDLGIEITEGSNPTIQECRIHDMQGRGLLVCNGGAGRIVQSTFTAIKSTAIHIRKEGNPTIQGCQISGNAGSGIMVDEQGRGTVMDCTIRENEGRGIEVYHGSNPWIKGCKFAQGKHTAIAFGEWGTGTIENCDIEANESYGLKIELRASPLIRDCQIHGGKSAGVLVNNQGAGVLKNCKIFDNALGEVRVRARSNVRIEGGRIEHHTDEPAVLITDSSAMLDHCLIKSSQSIGLRLRSRSKVTLRACNIRCGPFGLVLSDMSLAQVDKHTLVQSSQYPTSRIVEEGSRLIKYVDEGH